MLKALWCFFFFFLQSKYKYVSSDLGRQTEHMNSNQD